MQKARRHTTMDAPTACRRTVSGALSLLFSRFFSPFPHGTCSLSVSYPIFSLTGWSRLIHTEFHVFRATQDIATLQIASCKGLSPAMAGRSGPFHSRFFLRSRDPTTPVLHCYNTGLGFFPFARHY